jgi:hypothetical protein
MVSIDARRGAENILPEWQNPGIGDVAAPMTGVATP